MISTYSQVKSRVLALLDDPLQATFRDAIVLEGMGEAIDALYSALLNYQIPRIKAISNYTLNAGITSLTPATAGIADFGELIHIEERASGSTDKFTPVWEVNDLSQRDAGEALLEFEWRGDTFWFIGANSPRELRFAYFASTEQPTDFTGDTGIDGAKTFLAKYTAAIIGPRKGYVELGQSYMTQAVGPRYDQGVIGGELFRLCAPMIRSMQRVQIAPRPYSATRRLATRRARPYVAVQPGITGGSGGVTFYEFTTADGTLTGTVDGVNAVFFTRFPVTSAKAFVNGIRMTRGNDYTHSANVITFLAGSIPQVSSDPTNPTIITVEGWL